MRLLSNVALGCVLLAGFASASVARADEFYADPETGSMSGDGSAQKPWSTLEAVVQAGLIGKTLKAGDTLWLRSGYHGALNLKGGNYAPAITLAAGSGEQPKLSRAGFAGVHGVVLRGVSISPSHATPAAKVDTLVTVDKTSSEVEVRDCELFSVEDASGFTADQWINATSSGISLSGDHVTASHNRVTNVRFGISADGPNDVVEYNEVVNFSADGMRGLGDGELFQYNVVKNVYVSGDDGDDNHDDGFQSWSTGANGPGSGVVTGITLRGNYFLNREDPNQKLTNSMQGIGCFDGMFDGWVVENNVVATDHWHGISFYGMRNSRVVNNTVIDVTDGQPGPPWIMVTAHKDGTPSENVIVRNNLATDYDVSGNSITNDHNTTLKDLTSFFVNPGKFDLHLLPKAPAVDQGSMDQAPMLDLDRIARPQGAGVDLGAYEWHDASVQPVDAGSGGASGSAGASTGGSAATAGRGASATGGRSASGGTSASGSGGVKAGTGGLRSGSGGASASGGRAAGNGSGGARGADAGVEKNAKDDGGCGCSLVRASEGASRWLLVLAALIAVATRTRRRQL